MGQLSQKYFQNFSGFPEGLCHGFDELYLILKGLVWENQQKVYPQHSQTLLSSSHEEIMIGCEVSK